MDIAFFFTLRSPYNQAKMFEATHPLNPEGRISFLLSTESKQAFLAAILLLP